MSPSLWLCWKPSIRLLWATQITKRNHPTSKKKVTSSFSCDSGLTFWCSSKIRQGGNSKIIHQPRFLQNKITLPQGRIYLLETTRPSRLFGSINPEVLPMVFKREVLKRGEGEEPWIFSVMLKGDTVTTVTKIWSFKRKCNISSIFHLWQKNLPKQVCLKRERVFSNIGTHVCIFVRDWRFDGSPVLA